MGNPMTLQLIKYLETSSQEAMQEIEVGDRETLNMVTCILIEKFTGTSCMELIEQAKTKFGKDWMHRDLLELVKEKKTIEDCLEMIEEQLAEARVKIAGILNRRDSELIASIGESDDVYWHIKETKRFYQTFLQMKRQQNKKFTEELIE